MANVLIVSLWIKASGKCKCVTLGVLWGTACGTPILFFIFKKGYLFLHPEQVYIFKLIQQKIQKMEKWLKRKQGESVRKNAHPETPKCRQFQQEYISL